MAFDQATRNKLQKFVSDARGLLTEEFSRQLQNDYGMDPDTGLVSPIDSLPNLTDAQHQTAILLRETMAHYQASDSGNDAREILGRIVREQAFTVLNRLCALRMAEARDILMESITKAYNSKGFQLYARVAGISLGETGNTYRNYLFSVFDEFSIDLTVLFDRYSPMGRLFPKETALLGLLGKINDMEIETLWAEDETIGWIYQYFNSKEERKKMRDESQAPRNSRELAVRNQFFTPRYVVEFLTDNTLGRIWYEMTKGNTNLKDQCRYLVRRPNEIFLKKGEKAPEQKDTDADLSQEELLAQTVYIEHRPMKDPREILMLDPACGSMHFGLYAFDLFETIYEEAWDLQSTGQWQGADNRKLGLLTEIYTTKDELFRDIPRLIIENNIHGIDIDPRAVQIAGLSLWLRVQRSWKEQNVKPANRPQIRKSNIVCAEPMPGEKEFLKAFSESLKPKVLGQLLEIIFEKMELTGEAGSLLKIEEEIADAVERAREEFNKELLRRKDEAGCLPGFAPKVRQRELFDFADLPDKTQFWQTAEIEILDALRNYSEQAEAEDGGRLRLFAEDAAKGFAFIDLCRKRYDVVVMNPPFGDAVPTTRLYLTKAYPSASKELATCFVGRGSIITSRIGLVGAITSRFMLANDGLIEWRKEEFLSSTWNLQVFSDLGYGVLDAAMVEACSYVVGKSLDTFFRPFINCLDENDKGQSLLKAICSFSGNLNRNIALRNLISFLNVPDNIICYWLPEKLLTEVLQIENLKKQGSAARVGLQTGDNERFVRATWEISALNIGRDKDWCFFAKGGEYEPFYDDIHLVVWWQNKGYLLKNFFGLNGKLLSRPQNLDFYFQEGITYPDRTTSDFSPRVMPSGIIFSSTGFALFPPDRAALLGYLGSAYSRPFKILIEAFVGSGDSSVSGSAARHYRPGILNHLPNLMPTPDIGFQDKIKQSIQMRMQTFENDETSRYFSGLPILKLASFISIIASAMMVKHIECVVLLIESNLKIEKVVKEKLNIQNDDIILDELYGKHPAHFSRQYQHEGTVILESLNLTEEELIARLVEADGAGRSTVKKSYFADRTVELVCRIFNVHPHTILKLVVEYNFVTNAFVSEWTKKILSFGVGSIFGRWDIRYSIGERQPPELPDPFNPLPACPPGMLQNTVGLPAEPKDVPSDYPLRISWPGIIVDDEGHSEDIITRVHEAMDVIWKDKANEIEQEACEILGVRSLREYFAKSAKFFADHLKRYSKSRRQAPIYWPLSTPSGSYTLWLYYHRLTDQALYTCVNNFVGPKLKDVTEDADNLRKKSNRSSQEEKELEKLSDLALELNDFHDELLRIAGFWKPNLNDGVQITAAPLWKLFQHKPWQKTLKQTWKDLEKGKYDWAHLAYSIWPERVIRASHKDRSYAIAHDLEDDLWEEVETGTDRQGNPKTKWVPKDLGEKGLKQLIAQKIGGKA